MILSFVNQGKMSKFQNLHPGTEIKLEYVNMKSYFENKKGGKNYCTKNLIL